MEEEEPERISFIRRFGHAIKTYWHSILVVIIPLVCALLFLDGDKPMTRCGYLVVVVSLYWIFEAMPLPASSLIPIVMFPLMGIMDSDHVCIQYFRETNMLLVAGFLMAVSFEFSNLHRRIALKMMLKIGISHLRLTLVLAVVTMFLSMWINKILSATIMIPIATAVLFILEELGLVNYFKPLKENYVEEVDHQYPSRTTICYFLIIAYSATLGGLGTLTGSYSNYTFKEIFEARFPDAPQIIFGSWMAYNIPTMLISTILIWLCLNWQFLGFLRNSGADTQVIQQKLQHKEMAAVTAQMVHSALQYKYTELGKMTFVQWSVLIIFILMFMLSFFREPDFMMGWAEALSDKKVKNSAPVIFILLLYFTLPLQPTFLHMFSTDNERVPNKISPSILSWKSAIKKIPWGMAFLIGGSFALSEGSKVTGLSKHLSSTLNDISHLPPFVIMLIACVYGMTLSEIYADEFTVEFMMPVLADIAVSNDLNPLYLMIPTTVTCSLTFLLPVGTPPNAFAAGVANIRTKDMILGGILPSVITLILVIVMFPTWGLVVYKGPAKPHWAK